VYLAAMSSPIDPEDVLNYGLLGQRHSPP